MNTLSWVAASATDAADGLYVADSNNNRVLYFPSGSVTPSRLYGQSDSFETGTANKGGRSASTLVGPAGVAADATGLYIADTGNNRVLHYTGTSTTADAVYGQLGKFNTGESNQGGTAPSRTSLNTPTGIDVDSAGGLYVADQGNQRVLHSRPEAPLRIAFTGTVAVLLPAHKKMGEFLRRR